MPLFMLLPVAIAFALVNAPSLICHRHRFLFPDSILNSQHLDDGDDNLDVAMPDDLNDQNLSELASSISAHDLNSMSQALTVSVLNSALDINTANNNNVTANTVPISASNNAAAFRSAVTAATAAAAAGVVQGRRPQQVNGLPGMSGVQQPSQPLTFPILQGQLLQGHLVTGSSGGPLVQGPTLTQVPAQRPPPKVTTPAQRQLPQLPLSAGQRPLLQGPPNAIVQGSVVQTVRGSNASLKQQQNSPAVSRDSKQAVPAPVVSTPNPRTPSSGGIVQNLLQSPPIVAPPPVHQHRPNILQSSRMNHTVSFPIQGQSIQAQEIPRPSPRGSQGQQQGRGQSEGQAGPQQNSSPQQQQQHLQQQKDQISVIRAQLPQGPPTLPPNQLQIQMPSALAALGGTAFTVNPQTALMAAASVGGKAQSQLFSSPPPGRQQSGIVPNLVPPSALVSGQINGNMLNATEQLKQLVSQSPVTMTPNNKKRSRSKRSNKHLTNMTGGNVPQNHVATTANQSQQTATTMLPLLTANQFRADGNLPATGLKLALPLAMLPGRHDVSAVLTTVNGTTQETAKPTHAHVAPKRSRSSSASAKKQKTQTNPQNPVRTS